ncbi:UDP-glucose 4-epimerase GalE [Paracoccus tegillarcae]|uniref:UDP-glucose 4-epimerase n=1 Tax=Paracoccus tegillarcae TaxID=1529068 RepID=A0A2K9EST5_9RHOB|nr:UDP-glucose 4-epimerase GalE [Paracoccus tegillarcae]AUH34795.1 UDP-glucose 4-epimerase GalE [Paracoccus tegillarcae]
MSGRVLLTGGAGFIGAHSYVALVEAGFDPVILDSFHNARRDLPDRLARITGRPTPVIEADIRDAGAMDDAMRGAGFDAVVHFAGLKSVPDSETDPIGYYDVNVAGLVNVMQAMRKNDVRRIVFSSSAAVYGEAETMPVTETSPTNPGNTYAHTKLIGERFLAACRQADPALRLGILRYFNPVGAHASGLIGEDPSQPAGNLVPVIAQVATGERDRLMIFGDDWPTPDGTAIRDYIHVEDLARGHVLSLQALLRPASDPATASHLVNLGTGRGYSVREVIECYEKVSERPIRFDIAPRRAGDAAISYADTARADDLLGFRAQHDLTEMCRSNWAFIRAKA